MSFLTPNRLNISINGVIRDLSFNEIYGDIPFSISKLKQLENL